MTDLNSTEPPATPSDILLGRVLVVLGVIGVLDLLGIVYLAAVEVPVPDALVATLGAAVTGLAGLLAGRRP